MFQKQQTVDDTQEARKAYLSILEKGKQLGLQEEVHTEPVRRSENDTHPIVESDTDDAPVDTTVSRRSVKPNCLPKPFDPDAACDKDDFIPEDSFPDPVEWRQRRRGSKESRMSVMFLKDWVTTVEV